jgi:hypothetical protein
MHGPTWPCRLTHGRSGVSLLAISRSDADAASDGKEDGGGARSYRRRAATARAGLSGRVTGWSRGASGGVLPCSSDLPRRVLLRSISRAELGGGGLRRGGGGRGCLGRAPRGVSCSFRGGSRSFSRPCHVRLLLRRTPRIDYGGVKSGNLESVRGCVRARTKRRAEGNREGVMRESGASSSCSPPRRCARAGVTTPACSRKGAPWGFAAGLLGSGGSGVR